MCPTALKGFFKRDHCQALKSTDIIEHYIKTKQARRNEIDIGGGL